MSPEDDVEYWLVLGGYRHGVSQVGADWVRCWGNLAFQPGERAVLGMKVKQRIEMETIILLRSDDGRVFYAPVVKPRTSLNEPALNEPPFGRLDGTT